MPPQLQTVAPLRGHPPTRPSQRHHQNMLPPRADRRTSTRPPHPNNNHHQSVHSHHLQNHLQHGDLRKAYKSQINDSNGSGHFDDHTSMSSVSATNSGATPSSVYMPSVPLSRDFSDLSGLSGGTRGSSVPGQIFDPKSFVKPWKQAYLLSNVPPEQVVLEKDHKMENSEEGCKNKKNHTNSVTGRINGVSKNATRAASIWVVQNDVVEIFDNLHSSLGLDRFQMVGHNRIPVMILLMDPHRHSYELMQIWVDRTIDSIRDLVHALQHKLPDKWKQAYDGIFQVRGHRFTQLINIIRLVKYDVQPHEILVAKPWAMTAKVTIAFAGTAIRHLTNIGVINPNDGVQIGQPRHKSEDAPLLLSKQALERAYFPEGILNHHHAVQFITFSPPFESSGGVCGGVHGHDDSQTLVGSGCSDSQGAAARARSLMAPLNVQTNNNNPPSPKSVVDLPMVDPVSGNMIPASNSYCHHIGSQNGGSTRQNNEHRFERFAVSGSGSSQQFSSPSGVRGFFSKFNCFRTFNQEMMVLKVDDNGSGSTRHHEYRESPLTSLSEDEEIRWLAYSMQPIAEDQSLTGHSIVSMSAPLLSPITPSFSSTRHQPDPPGYAGAYPQQQQRQLGLTGRNGHGFGNNSKGYEF